MDAQIQVVELLKEQNELLKKCLWRIRFSLLTLLLLTTAICCGLGFVIYTQQRGPRPVVVPPPFRKLTTGTFPAIDPDALKRIINGEAPPPTPAREVENRNQRLNDPAFQVKSTRPPLATQVPASVPKADPDDPFK